MARQNFANHVRYYFPHHVIFYPLITTAFAVSVWLAYDDAFNRNVWIAMAILFLFITAVAFMLRQHYALGNQNRVIRLELRLRYYILTNKRFEEIEVQLTRGQLYALRFAPDDEFVDLIKRAVAESLPPKEIKRSIKKWLPDEMRV